MRYGARPLFGLSASGAGVLDDHDLVHAPPAAAATICATAGTRALRLCARRLSEPAIANCRGQEALRKRASPRQVWAHGEVRGGAAPAPPSAVLICTAAIASAPKPSVPAIDAAVIWMEALLCPAAAAALAPAETPRKFSRV